jgi:hypothetical protein
VLEKASFSATAARLVEFGFAIYLLLCFTSSKIRSSERFYKILSMATSPQGSALASP